MLETEIKFKLENPEEMRQKLKDFAKEYNDQLLVDRGMGYEADVFQAYLKIVSEGQARPSIKEITNTYNSDLVESEHIGFRGMGNIIRKQLKLKPRRSTGGSYIVDFNENKRKIEVLKNKYGVPDDNESVNQVNQVNLNTKKNEEPVKENPFEGKD